ncbi:hypothetical protein HZS_1343 [Henneguya salminicola]|nr:hypothetical protein HZS_1343 [Henneguya salminicola]
MYGSFSPNFMEYLSWNEDRKNNALEQRYAEVCPNSYSVVFRALIRYGKSPLEEFNIYLLNN